MKIIEVELLEQVEAKQLETTTKVSTYQAAQIAQLQFGGPGPVADYDIMEIVNEHNGQFQIVVKEQATQE